METIRLEVRHRSLFLDVRDFVFFTEDGVEVEKTTTQGVVDRVQRYVRRRLRGKARDFGRAQILGALRRYNSPKEGYSQFVVVESSEVERLESLEGRRREFALDDLVVRSIQARIPVDHLSTERWARDRGLYIGLSGKNQILGGKCRLTREGLITDFEPNKLVARSLLDKPEAFRGEGRALRVLVVDDPFVNAITGDGACLVKATAARDCSRVVEPRILKHFKASHAPSTYRADKGRLAIIVEHFGSTPIDRVSQGDVREFLDGLIVDDELSGKTVNRYASVLSVAFDYAVQKNLARRNPVKGIKRHKEEEVAIPFISDDDVDALITASTDDEFAIFVRLAADSGLRRSESIRLIWGDIDLERGALLVRKSKNHASREVPLTASLKAALKQLRAARDQKDRRKAEPVFPHYQTVTPGAVTGRFRSLAKRAGFDGLRLHDMRHAFCSRLAQAGVPIPTIKVLAGHKSIATTMRYAGHVPGGATFEAIRRLDKPDQGTEGDAKGDTET